MFDINSLNKLTDAIPAEAKEKVKEVVKQQLSGKVEGITNDVMSKLGLTSHVSEQASDAATATPTADSAEAKADNTAELKVDGTEQLEASESEEESEEGSDVA